MMNIKAMFFTENDQCFSVCLKFFPPLGYAAAPSNMTIYLYIKLFIYLLNSISQMNNKGKKNKRYLQVYTEH